MEKLLFTTEEAAEILCVGRSRIFDLIRTGQLRSLKIGKSRRVTREALEEFVVRSSEAA
jgi:excisionase family DNA binding protein